MYARPAGQSLELGDVKPVVATAQAIPVAFATPVAGVDLMFLAPLRKLVEWTSDY